MPASQSAKLNSSFALSQSATRRYSLRIVTSLHCVDKYQININLKNWLSFTTLIINRTFTGVIQKKKHISPWKLEGSQNLICAERKVGIFQGELALGQGLSALILGSGITPCASQIYPYVTKKLRVLRCASTTPLVAAPPPPETGCFIRCLFPILIKFTLGLTDLQAVTLSSAQIFLQRSDVSGLACWVTVVSCPPPHHLLPLPSLITGHAKLYCSRQVEGAACCFMKTYYHAL